MTNYPANKMYVIVKKQLDNNLIDFVKPTRTLTRIKMIEGSNIATYCIQRTSATLGSH